MAVLEGVPPSTLGVGVGLSRRVPSRRLGHSRLGQASPFGLPPGSHPLCPLSSFLLSSSLIILSLFPPLSPGGAPRAPRAVDGRAGADHRLGHDPPGMAPDNDPWEYAWESRSGGVLWRGRGRMGRGTGAAARRGAVFQPTGVGSMRIACFGGDSVGGTAGRFGEDNRMRAVGMT